MLYIYIVLQLVHSETYTSQLNTCTVNNTSLCENSFGLCTKSCIDPIVLNPGIIQSPALLGSKPTPLAAGRTAED